VEGRGVGVHETAIDVDSDRSTKMGRIEMSCGTKRKEGWLAGRENGKKRWIGKKHGNTKVASEL
jgi:hypothetical protein